MIPALREYRDGDEPLLAPLVAESLGQGFQFLSRLRTEIAEGSNRYDRAGEVLLLAESDSAVVGVGGLNQEPFLRDPSVGRIRRVYVLDAFRGQGVGAHLVRELLSRAAPYFRMVTLRSASPDSSRFYERLGFEAVTNIPDVTHTWIPGA